MGAGATTAGSARHRALIAVAAIEVLAASSALAGGLPGSGRPAGGTVPVARPPAVTAVAAGGSSSRGGVPNGPLPLRAGAARRGDASMAPTGPVLCRTDLPLADAPDTGYSFLCSQGATPLTWAGGRISIYDSGLTPPQSAAFAVALAQWAAAARFEVVHAPSAADAQVTVGDSALTPDAGGWVEDAYTTVSYRCSPRCAYYSARVELSSTAALTQPGWVSTILHELGHVAGLNHVSRTGEAMYPYLTAAPPVTYQPGDLAGLDVLAAERGA